MAGLLLLLVSLAGGIVFSRERARPAVSTAPPSVAAPVEGKLRVEPELDRFLGVIIVESSVDLSSRLTGQVESVRVQIGSAVKQGDIVATLETQNVRQELAVAEASLLSSQAELEMATVELAQTQERLRRRQSPQQLSTGAISEEELSAAHYAQQLAEAKLSAARARLQEHQARVAQWRRRVEEGVVRAPFEGVISGRFVHPGALVREGQPLVHVMRRGRPQVRFAIPSTERRHVAAGDAIVVEDPGRNLFFKGRVTQVAPEVDVASLMVFALADVELAQPVPAGTAVQVQVLAEEAP